MYAIRSYYGRDRVGVLPGGSYFEGPAIFMPWSTPITWACMVGSTDAKLRMPSTMVWSLAIRAIRS